MRKIPCKGLGVLEGTEAHGRMLAHIQKFRKRSVLASLVSIIFVPFALAAVGFVYLIVFGMSIMIGVGLQALLSETLGELLSGAVIDLVVTGIFWVVEAIIIFPFLIVILALLVMLYNSVKTLFSSQPNVANAIYLVESLQEAEEVTVPNTLSSLPYRAFRYLWNGSIGRVKGLSLDNLSRKAYEHGGAISETEVKMMAFTALSSHPSSTGRLRVEVDKHGGLASMVVFVGAVGSTGWLPEVIAIFDKKHLEEILEKIDSCCPNATIRTESESVPGREKPKKKGTN